MLGNGMVLFFIPFFSFFWDYVLLFILYLRNAPRIQTRVCLCPTCELLLVLFRFRERNEHNASVREQSEKVSHSGTKDHKILAEFPRMKWTTWDAAQKVQFSSSLDYRTIVELGRWDEWEREKLSVWTEFIHIPVTFLLCSLYNVNIQMDVHTIFVTKFIFHFLCTLPKFEGRFRVFIFALMHDSLCQINVLISFCHIKNVLSYKADNHKRL